MYFCRNCGLQYNTDQAVMCIRCRAPKGMGNQFCPCCGNPTQPQQKVCMNCGVEVEQYDRPVGRKSKALAGVFGILWGMFGVHNFYLGYFTKAIVQLCISILSFILYMVGIFGLAWLGDSFVASNKAVILELFGSLVQAEPWTFAFVLFFVSVLLYSQAATARAVMPIGVAMGLPPQALIGMFPAVNGYFFIPTYGSLVAAISFDLSGTTRIGKYVLNHSFMLPGLVATVTAVAVGFGIGSILF